MMTLLPIKASVGAESGVQAYRVTRALELLIYQRRRAHCTQLIDDRALLRSSLGLFKSTMNLETSFRLAYEAPALVPTIVHNSA